MFTRSHQRPERRPSRRAFLRAGAIPWLGLGLPELLRRRALAGTASPAAARPIRGVILAFCSGGISQLETFDPKPDAPAEIRGEFGTIPTAVPGARFGEHLPRLARQLDRIALVRSMRTTSAIHELAVHRLLGGVDELPPNTGVRATRNDRPHLGSLLAAARGGRTGAGGLPAAVTLPSKLAFEGTTFPGQDAGFLGARFDPWQIVAPADSPELAPPDLALPEGLDLERLRGRLGLLETIDAQRAAIDGRRAGGGGAPLIDEFRARALEMLGSGVCREAFDLDREPPARRDRFGRNAMGQGLLLGRRLVEAGVPLVQVNLGESNVWDTHANNFGRLRDTLLPPFDAAVSALIDDLDERGLADEVLVVVTGEFGRTPRIGVQVVKEGAGAKPDGRDHWASAFSLIAFGAGVGRGLVLGSTDRNAALPTTASFTPADLAAGILAGLGVDLDAEILDTMGRPFPVNRGTPIPWA